MATAETKSKLKANSSNKTKAILAYYQLVRKGASPEQTRKDFGLRIEDIANFDFSVFKDTA